VSRYFINLRHLYARLTNVSCFSALNDGCRGESYKKGVTHCDEHKTHVPLIRAKFRAEHLALEHSMVLLLARGKGKTVLNDMMKTFGEARNANRSILFENMTEVPSFPEQNQL
jgi:hypothetical protein